MIYNLITCFWRKSLETDLIIIRVRRFILQISMLIISRKVTFGIDYLLLYERILKT